MMIPIRGPTIFDKQLKEFMHEGEYSKSGRAQDNSMKQG